MEATLKSLICERGQVKASLTRFRTFLDSFERTSSVTQLKSRLEKVTPLFEKFETLQNQIEALVAETSHAQAQAADRIEFENMYFDITCTAQDLLLQLQSESQPIATPTHQILTPPASSSIEPRLRLPTLSIPTFDGTYTKWIKFRDTFISLVHNNCALTNIEKFHYLTSSVQGEAEQVIESFGVSDNNYIPAWEALTDRYEDINTLRHYYLEALIEFPRLTKETTTGLRQLLNNTNNNLKALEALGEPTDHWDSIVIYLLTKKMDGNTLREWEHRESSIQGTARLQDILAFLGSHCKYLEKAVKDAPRPTLIKNTVPEQRVHRPKPITAHVARTQTQCLMCKNNHPLYRCEQFLQLSVTERINKIRQLRACFNCLQVGHRNLDCTHGNCQKCSKKHHTLIHMDASSVTVAHAASITEDAQRPSTSETQIQETTQSYISRTSTNCTMLSTAIVDIKDHRGIKHKCRALLDSGSQSHFITSSFIKKLGLPRTKTDIRVSGIAKMSQSLQHQASVEISSKYNGFNKTINCLVLPNISNKIPNSEISVTFLPIPSNFTLADPQFYQPADIDMIIGGGLFWDVLCIGRHSLGPKLPSLQKTQFGWIVVGTLDLSSHRTQTQTNCHMVVTNKELHDQMARFWELEQCNERQPNKLDYCEKHFESTVKRSCDGRYTVNIPFTERVTELGNSRQQAERRLLNLERKLEKQPSLRQNYVDFMNEYEALGHMTEISDNGQNTETAYYLPHHAVIKASSSTTKLRVVFDGSAKTTSGLSLNDVQLVGPVVQNDLLSILLRFRKHRYVLSADITKMYRQILVQEGDRKYQRILWRENSSSPIKEYQLNTVTYGTAAAPFLATRTLRHIGERHTNSHPIVSRVIMEDFYVDDLLSGTDSICEAKRVRTELISILNASGFELRKWASNDTRILKETDSQTKVQVTTERDSKTLGLFWEPERDILRFTVQETLKPTRITKRTILSEIAQIFDPLGLIGPATIQAKIILQELWQLQVSWDESLPQHLHAKWAAFRLDLQEINKIIIPRRTLPASTTKIELHGFCDASEKAYGACVYLRALDNHGQWVSRLLCGKSRVAPLKTVSLPRLELCGALLLAQLVKRVRTSLNSAYNEYYWTDSTITLAWIKASPNRWKTFVANRSAEIQELSRGSWAYVSSKDNPADIISRGINPSELRHADLWWHGPLWLSEDTSKWPSEIETSQLLSDQESEEVEPLQVLTASTVPHNHLLDKFSSLTKLLRVTAYCLRFVENARALVYNRNATIQSKRDIKSGYLTSQELIQAEITIIRIAQAECFSTEIKQLKAGQSVTNSSSLQPLDPFLDVAGLLRVGGRLRHAKIPYNQKHPIILPSKHRITKLFIAHEHLRLLHAGSQATLHSLRRRYWPLNGKNSVKNIIRNCVKCFKVKPVTPNHLMGDLPAARIVPARPFYTCGVDYAGPVLIKERTRARTTLKAYLCIFVCFTTKAVHIELAHDLSTEAFLNCLRRFISRRGLCHSIYSDNGTNFIGARNELQDLARLLTDDTHNERVQQFLSNSHIQWHLIPPNAPHFGGLWEAAVKSTKYHLRRVIGETKVTYEELYTLLTQVEACLNSRPLYPLSNEPTDLSPLTPSHFLIGDSMTAFPDASLSSIPENRLNRYQLVQRMLQHFWQRWQTEYLHQLQQRTKWRVASQTNFGPGTLVIVKEDNLPPLRWRMGRITELHPGKDTITRVVSIQVSGGIIKRPVSKICILPLGDDKDADLDH